MCAIYFLSDYLIDCQNNQANTRWPKSIVASLVWIHCRRHTRSDYTSFSHAFIRSGLFDIETYCCCQPVLSVWTIRCGNVAAILELDEHLQREFIIFEAAPQETRGIPSKKPVADYFLWSVWVGSHRVSKYPVPFLTSHPPSCCWTVLLVLTLSRRDRKICQST